MAYSDLIRNKLYKDARTSMILTNRKLLTFMVLFGCRFAYPDPAYLNRVLESLATRGVTPESAVDPQEYKEFTQLFW